MRHAVLTLGLALLTLPAVAQFQPPAIQEAFESALVIGTARGGDAEQPFALYLPPDYDADKPWPLVVFLHGIGERGTDGLLQTRVGIGPAINANPERFPCLVLMPQCAPRTVWTHDSSMAQIDDAIAQVQRDYAVDSDRIALTGLSMGAFGLYAYGANNIERFSATMAICGGGSPDNAKRLALRPMRVFHGADDFVVKPERSAEMVDAVRAVGGDVAYTLYPDTGHDSWVKAYADSDNIAWLLAQVRPKP